MRDPAVPDAGCGMTDGAALPATRLLKARERGLQQNWSNRAQALKVARYINLQGYLRGWPLQLDAGWWGSAIR